MEKFKSELNFFYKIELYHKLQGNNTMNFVLFIEWQILNDNR